MSDKVTFHCETIGCMTPALPGKTRCADCEYQLDADTERIRAAMHFPTPEVPTTTAALVPVPLTDFPLDVYRAVEPSRMPFCLTRRMLALVIAGAALMVILFHVAHPGAGDYVSAVQTVSNIFIALGLMSFGAWWYPVRKQWLEGGEDEE